MNLRFKLLFSLLVLSLCVYGQRKKYPKDLTPYCKLTKDKKGKKILKCSKLPIDLVGAADSEGFEIVAVCKDKRKINAIIRNKKHGRNSLLLYTAEKKGFKWEQKIAMDMNVSNDIIMAKKEIIQCFFPDTNTLFIGYMLESGEKKAYLIRLTHRRFRVYESSFNPSKNSLYYKSEEGTIRPRY